MRQLCGLQEHCLPDREGVGEWDSVPPELLQVQSRRGGSTVGTTIPSSSGRRETSASLRGEEMTTAEFAATRMWLQDPTQPEDESRGLVMSCDMSDNEESGSLCNCVGTWKLVLLLSSTCFWVLRMLDIAIAILPRPPLAPYVCCTERREKGGWQCCPFSRDWTRVLLFLGWIMFHMDTAKRVVLDAKVDYPAASSAVLGSLVETGGLNDIVETLQTADVRLYGGSRASSVPNIPQTLLFHHEYNSVACAIKIVDDVEGAIGHIHRHGSAHTEYNC
ncbi:hypothetical protein MLD38_012974 [Melastoma candidum]|uniref:Uncharacterized protein n=1 Tax=Melastoma candidum TaxID=119954 RepID=A0ACB9R879_9MYRT|nr:hypothetical protein MLD38_012974 [Melastoma candidum]